MSHPRESDAGRFIAAGDVRLWTRIEGAGRRLLVVHGGPGLDHHLVAPLAGELARGFEIWSPDLPGHGRSARDDGRTPGLRQLQDRLASWIDHLPFRFDAVIGHSLGAWLVREMLRHGELETSAVVLVSPPASGQTARGSSVRRAARVAGVTSADPDPRREVRLHLEAECGGRLPDGADDLLDVATLTHVSHYRGLVRNLHRRLTSPPRPFCPSCPVLVIVGEDDRTTPVEHASAVAAKIAGARLEVLDGLGHYPFFQNPRRVASVIADFIPGSQA